MSKFVTVIGGMNIDISAAIAAQVVQADSNPGTVTLGCGGVARNIAANLCLLGHQVKLVTVLGNDAFGNMCRNNCHQAGIDLSLTERCHDERNGLYICVNDHRGELVVAVADTDIIHRITPTFLMQRLPVINQSAAVIADTNIGEDALTFLLDNCRPPLLIDTVSTAKAARVVAALQRSRNHSLHTLKLNRMEALSVTGCPDVTQAAARLNALGAEHVYVTLGADGVLCSDGITTERLPSTATTVVNTTGAGDAFLAGVAAAMLRQVPFPATARFGLTAARAALLTAEAVNPQIATFFNQQ